MDFQVGILTYFTDAGVFISDHNEGFVDLTGRKQIT